MYLGGCRHTGCLGTDTAHDSAEQSSSRRRDTAATRFQVQKCKHYYGTPWPQAHMVEAPSAACKPPAAGPHTQDPETGRRGGCTRTKDAMKKPCVLSSAPVRTQHDPSPPTIARPLFSQPASAHSVDCLLLSVAAHELARARLCITSGPGRTASPRLLRGFVLLFVMLCNSKIGRPALACRAA